MSLSKVGIGCAMASIVLGGTSMVLSSINLDNRSSIKSDLQEQVKEYGISQKEYEKIENRANSNSEYWSGDVLTWQQALDSLQNDAACKKAYMEGAQMVRDSIANAQKVK